MNLASGGLALWKSFLVPDTERLGELFMSHGTTGYKRLQAMRAVFSCSLVLLFAVDHPARCQSSYGEVIDIRSGFARVTVANEAIPPQASDFQVSWRRQPQNIRGILGGPGSSIEVGIAVDISASMQRNLDSMKAAIGEFLGSELSAADRVFLVTISDRIEFVTEGLEPSLNSLAALSIDTRPGVRPTRFFDGVEEALSHFENSSARAVLLVASDACDSLQQKGAGARILDKAANMAIPIVLIAPGRRDCRSATCKPTRSGEWNCSEAAPSGIPVRVMDRDASDPTRGPIDIPSEFLTSPATIARDQFVGRLEAGGGALIVARSAAEWTRGIESVRSLLDRQWTVVFEPTSAALRSSEVRVKVHEHSRPASSAEQSAESQQEEVQDISSSPPSPAPVAVARNPPSIAEQIGVEVVNVDVVVADSRGRRLVDLARGEFQLEIDGKAQTLDYFSPPRGFALENEEPRELPPEGAARRPSGTTFFVLDRATLEARVLRQVVESLREIASAPSSAGKTFVVASFADTLTLHTPGASDPDEVNRALDDVVLTGAQGGIRRLERRQLQEEVLATNQASVDLLISRIQAIEDQEVSRQASLVATIQDLVTTSADSEQPNTLLIATEGFSAEPERFLRELLSSVAGTGAQMLLTREGATSSRNILLLAELDRLAKTLQERRVTAYALSPFSGFGGPSSAEFRTTGRFLGAAPREDESLAESAANFARLADATGGSRIPIFSDLKERLGAITLDGQASYSLGFTTGPEAGFDSHRIRVATSRAGTSLRYRTSFRRLSPVEQWQAALAAAARSGIVHSALPIELRADANPPPRSGQNRRVPVSLVIPLAHLTFQSSVDRSSDESALTVQLAVSDSAGALTRGPEEAIEISIPHADFERALGDYWSHRIEVEVSEGRSGIGALVIEKSTGVWATASLSIVADE